MTGEWFGLDPAEWSQALWTIGLGATVSVSCALLGCYLVLRRMSLLGDAISHAILPGIVLAFLISGRTSAWPMLLGAIAFGLLAAFLTQTLNRAGQVAEDASMGVVFTSLFALGVLLINWKAADVDLDPGCVLYGLIEFASSDTVSLAGWELPRLAPRLALTLVAALAFVTLFWKELKIVSFDPALATAMGLSAVVVHYLLMAMVAVVTVTSFEAVGSILVIAMLIVPAAAGHLLSDRLLGMMGWAAAIAVLSAVLGYVADARYSTGVAGMMAVAAGGQFTLAVLLAPRHGLLSQAWHRAALSLRIASEDVVGMLYRLEEAQSPGTGQRLARGDVARATGAGWIIWLALPRLRRRGQIEFLPGGDLKLTDRGRTVAQSLVRSHRLWEAFLVENFDLPLDHLHAPAERVEHFIGPALQDQLANELARPGLDPHGKQIPPPEAGRPMPL